MRMAQSFPFIQYSRTLRRSADQGFGQSCVFFIYYGGIGMKQHSRYQTARRILIFWTLFVGIGAVGGAIGILLDPSGRLMGRVGRYSIVP